MNGSISKDDRLWGMLCHIGVLGGHIIPLGNIIIPLVIWLMKREESEFVDYHGKESLNFQISLIIYLGIALLLSFLLIGIVLLLPLWIFGIVMVIIAGLKANEGQYYRYPYIIRILK